LPFAFSSVPSQAIVWLAIVFILCICAVARNKNVTSYHCSFSGHILCRVTFLSGLATK
jgi:hypothetical protein